MTGVSRKPARKAEPFRSLRFFTKHVSHSLLAPPPTCRRSRMHLRISSVKRTHGKKARTRRNSDLGVLTKAKAFVAGSSNLVALLPVHVQAASVRHENAGLSRDVGS